MWAEFLSTAGGWLQSAWIFLTTGWDAAKIITAVAGVLTIISTTVGIVLKFRNSGSRRVARLLEFIEEREAKLANARDAINRLAVLPSPARGSAAPTFPRDVLEPTLRQLKWGNLSKAKVRLSEAIDGARDRKGVAQDWATAQSKDQALAHLLLGATEAARQPADPGEFAASRAAALAEFDKALEIDPNDMDATQYAGLMLLQLANPAGALARFSKLVELAANDQVRRARAYRLQATAYAALPQPSLRLANAALKRALQTYPNGADQLELAEVNEQRGDALSGLGFNREANRRYQQSLQLYAAMQSTVAGSDGLKRTLAKLQELNSLPVTNGADASTEDDSEIDTLDTLDPNGATIGNGHAPPDQSG